MVSKQTCGTCRWAVFSRTDKGNIRRSHPGRCTHPSVLTADSLAAMREDIVKAVPRCVLIDPLRAVAIWPHYDKCWTWEERP